MVITLIFPSSSSSVETSKPPSVDVWFCSSMSISILSGESVDSDCVAASSGFFSLMLRQMYSSLTRPTPLTLGTTEIGMTLVPEASLSNRISRRSSIDVCSSVV